jgi:hypothetical protein
LSIDEKKVKKTYFLLLPPPWSVCSCWI